MSEGGQMTERKDRVPDYLLGTMLRLAVEGGAAGAPVRFDMSGEGHYIVRWTPRAKRAHWSITGGLDAILEAVSHATRGGEGHTPRELLKVESVRRALGSLGRDVSSRGLARALSTARSEPWRVCTWRMPGYRSVYWVQSRDEEPWGFMRPVLEACANVSAGHFVTTDKLATPTVRAALRCVGVTGRGSGVDGRRHHGLGPTLRILCESGAALDLGYRVRGSDKFGRHWRIERTEQ